LALLKTLVLKGCIVTADALHCHPRMAEGVLASGADYALGLKGNHGPLHAAAVSAFEQADAKGFLPFFETAEEAHDRKEWRCEPHRVSRRLQLLRGWSDDEASSSIFP